MPGKTCCGPQGRLARRLSLAAGLLGWFLAGPALAQTADAVEPVPRYAVEIIVFRNLDQTRTSAETPRPGQADETPFTAGQQPEFLLLDPWEAGDAPQPLDASQMELDGIWRRLERIGAYAPIVHLGWVQTAASRDLAIDYPLTDAASSNAGLSGNFRLFKERFLHLAVNLALRESNPRETMAADSALIRNEESTISESRRLRGGLLEYYDNPRFGVIASVRELPSTEPDQTQPAEQQTFNLPSSGPP
jgi:hypothetical protein